MPESLAGKFGMFSVRPAWKNLLPAVFSGCVKFEQLNVSFV